MKKSLILFFASLPFLQGNTQPQAADSSRIAALNQVYTEAIIQQDSIALKNTMTENFVITSGIGEIRDRTAEIRDLVAPGLKLLFFKIENPRYFMYPCSAVATGSFFWKIENPLGQAVEIRRSFTCSYTYDEKIWRMTSQHVGRL